jgi:hypothetical protein
LAATGLLPRRFKRASIVNSYVVGDGCTSLTDQLDRM